ncbi:helix-turn-helix domain-containing protein [Paenibacillus eucommiae]|uniref:Transcriptional regulator with XRE-family HTH domain n=1 Tax=Paenibacillus eucommiae TaxID=1355755 RepID=A0ABS4IZI5_9BACL|nr:helix-turn-helix domain-containing protein [Paenibacillus eucommiae]MBP1993004.1 transcriptional regulator with XRE-family HTH domain [Paenibacillus eucommiae]
MSESNKLNERLRALRLEHDFTQQELGDLLGVTAQAVSKWETGMATPDITLLPKISTLFKCSIDSLFFGSETVGAQDKKMTMIRADFSEVKIESSDLQGIVMRDVNLDGAEIFDSRLNDMRIHHGGMANLTLRHLDLDGLSIGFSQMNGAVIHDLGGHTVPIRFSENDFKRSTIDRCDLAGVEIIDCNLSGVKIKGSTLKDSWLLQPETCEPIYIEDVNLRDSVIKNCDLSGLNIQECQIDGLIINGISIKCLLEAYERSK